jgi:predicted kinase
VDKTFGMWKKKQNVKEEKIMKNLYIVRGLPGSGKSTFARSIAKSYQVFEADQYFMKKGKYNFDPTKLKDAHNDCKNRVSRRMRKNLFNSIFFSNIVVSNTFTQDWEMKFYRNIAKRYGYKVHTIVVENRHGGMNVHGVPADKVQVMEDRFEIKLK